MLQRLYRVYGILNGNWYRSTVTVKHSSFLYLIAKNINTFILISASLPPRMSSDLKLYSLFFNLCVVKVSSLIFRNRYDGDSFEIVTHSTGKKHSTVECTGKKWFTHNQINYFPLKIDEMFANQCLNFVFFHASYFIKIDKKMTILHMPITVCRARHSSHFVLARCYCALHIDLYRIVVYIVCTAHSCF